MKNYIVNMVVCNEATTIYINQKIGNDEVCLYNNYASNDSFIKNGIIIDENKFSNVLQKLVRNASLFIGSDITAVYLLIDIGDIRIKPFELTDISIKNGVFNKRLWELEIKPSIKLKPNSHFHTFDKEITSLKFGDKLVQTISDNTEIRAQKLSIYGNIYQINTIVYNSFINIFKKIGLKIIRFMPLINLLRFISENKEPIQYLTIYDDSIVLSLVSDNKLIKIITDETLGLNALYKMIIENTGLSKQQVKKYKKYYEAIFNISKDYDVMTIFSDKYLEIMTIKQNDMDSIFSKYMKKIAKFIETTIEYYKKEKNIDVNKLELVTNSLFVKKIFNVFNIYSSASFEINWNGTENINNEAVYTYAHLFAKNLVKLDLGYNCFSNELSYKNNSEFKLKGLLN